MLPLGLKQFRRIATRFENRGANYLAMGTVGIILLWLQMPLQKRPSTTSAEFWWHEARSDGQLYRGAAGRGDA